MRIPRKLPRLVATASLITTSQMLVGTVAAQARPLARVGNSTSSVSNFSSQAGRRTRPAMVIGGRRWSRSSRRTTLA